MNVFTFAEQKRMDFCKLNKDKNMLELLAFHRQDCLGRFKPLEDSFHSPFNMLAKTTELLRSS